MDTLAIVAAILIQPLITAICGYLVFRWMEHRVRRALRRLTSLSIRRQHPPQPRWTTPPGATRD